ncbi:efflux RND transporter permease subunit [Comamonas testosteroni]|uniref:efflux RND transporter permease subunit n=1 Tax=Comamonas testosteroni TaxID=285 RepID=UPI00068FEA10|nr:efflux RND transporter permease subunit [Comamonas testosteroni]
MSVYTKFCTPSLSLERPDVTYHLIVSTATNTKQNFDATVTTLIEGIALAAIVVFIFLRDWRSTLISAVAMPLSLIPTFAVIHLLGFTLNMLSLLGLTLVIGVLVDDAIVEVENIQKRVQSGQSPWQAAFHGADAIGLAVVATTFAIAVVFLPVAFMKGMVGPYFREFGLTVAIAVMFSLVVARLLTPVMAAYLMTPSSRHHEPKAFRGRYRVILEIALANRWKSIGSGLALFVASIGLASLLPTGFSPGSDSGVVQIAVQGPPGATLEDMRAGTKAMTAKLKSYPDVRQVFVTLGTSGRDGDPRIGTAIVLLKKERELTTRKFQEAIQPSLMSIPDIKLSFGESEDGSTVNTQVILTSDDVPLLAETTRELVKQMSALPMLTNVMEVTPRPGNELVIRLKDSEAARLGVTPDALASVARIASMGDIDSNAAKFNEGQRRLPIRVRLPDAVMRDIDAISALRVPTRDGHSVPLSAVANVTFEAGPSSLERFDRMRRATVQAQVVGASLGQANAAVEKLPLMKSLPQGVHRQLYGETENLTELFANFASAMAAGIGLIYCVLVLLFRSFFKPLTILTALPLSLAGAFVALLLTGGEMNLPVLIGLLMLMGLAAKNSILLVEHAIEAERAGMSQKQALLDAAHERSRPIVMTTIAMAAGMVPAALGLGGASDFRQPLAIAVIGGLISSTLLSLVLVPVFYGLVEDFENWLKPKLSKFVTPQTDSDVASLRRLRSQREG